MTFNEWLHAQQERTKDAVGDLARDVAGDPYAPDGYETLWAYVEALPGRRENVLSVVDAAWTEFNGRDPATCR
ncbi:YozE family protein [Limnoglobus roseus]|uniref:YozE SAM-like domain-containing protein n=1 Tax=Limnoglobus roseus TaxID=2598579 RepID=A0A5C1AR23_9BACT|nr:YozE family protein [Limnoglobus roseus]QEL20503.1 hypothetical protein PX52LOC_07607 [Limnoglobus roseus]